MPTTQDIQDLVKRGYRISRVFPYIALHNAQTNDLKIIPHRTVHSPTVIVETQKLFRQQRVGVDTNTPDASEWSKRDRDRYLDGLWNFNEPIFNRLFNDFNGNGAMMVNTVVAQYPRIHAALMKHRMN